jgi:hypothetical protein
MPVILSSEESIRTMRHFNLASLLLDPSLRFRRRPAFGGQAG